MVSALRSFLQTKSRAELSSAARKTKIVMVAMWPYALWAEKTSMGGWSPRDGL